MRSNTTSTCLMENAVKIYRKLPKDVRGEQTPEEFEEAQFLEKDLEDFLEKHLDKIEVGLKKIDRQYKTVVGSIDLYAEAKNGDLVVIELKRLGCRQGVRAGLSLYGMH